MKLVIKQQWLWLIWHRFFAMQLSLLVLLSVVLVTHSLSSVTTSFEINNTIFNRMHFLIVYFPISMLLTLGVQRVHVPDLANTGTRQSIFYQRLIRLLVIEILYWLVWSLTVILVLLFVVAHVKIPWDMLARADLLVLLSQLLISLAEICVMLLTRKRLVAFVVTWIVLAGLFVVAVNHGPSVVFAFATPQTAMSATGKALCILALLSIGMVGLGIQTSREEF